MLCGGSLFPECRPTGTRTAPVNVPGTSGVSCGHRIRPPASRKNYQEIYDELKKFGPAAEMKLGETPQSRELKKFLAQMAMERRTDKKIITETIRQRVDQGMAAYEESVQIRREKLRRMLLVEEASLAKELLDRVKKIEQSRMEDSKKQAEVLKRQEEEERLATVSAKRTQQVLRHCPTLRDSFSKRFTANTKHCNLVQMAENHAKQQQEKELEEFWHGLMLKEVAAKRSREVEEEKKRAEARKDTVEILAEQLASKSASEAQIRRTKEEEREHLLRLQEEEREEERRREEEERKKKAAARKDLEEQLSRAKTLREEREREVATTERMLSEMANEELARERAATGDTTRAARREILAYMEDLAARRKDEAKQNAEIDELIARYNAEAAARKDRIAAQRREARQGMLKEVLDVRERQLRDKTEALEREKRIEEMERELFAKEVEADAKLLQRERSARREKALRYGRELQEQRKYLETCSAKEAEENERMHRRSVEREAEYERLVQALSETSEGASTPHPFLVPIKELVCPRIEVRNRCPLLPEICRDPKTPLDDAPSGNRV